MTFDEKLLDFGPIRELLRGYCVCEMGRRRVDEISPVSDRAALEAAIGLVREMMNLLTNHREPPIEGMRDVRAHLAKVNREKAVLDPDELLDVRNFCEIAGQMRVFF